MNENHINIFRDFEKKCRKQYEWWRKWEIGKDIAVMQSNIFMLLNCFIHVKMQEKSGGDSNVVLSRFF